MFSKLFTGFTKGYWCAIQELSGRNHRDISALDGRMQALRTELSTSTGVALNARLIELEAAVEALQAVHKRDLGRVWRVLGNEAKTELGVDARSVRMALGTGNGEIDAELANWIALQSAPPSRGNGSQPQIDAELANWMALQSAPPSRGNGSQPQTVPPRP
jgi:hypothetical protein